MKKIASCLLALLLCVPMLFLVTSCDTEYTMEDFKNKMEAAGSYQISTTEFNTPYTPSGELPLDTKVDGNIWRIPYVSSKPNNFDQIDPETGHITIPDQATITIAVTEVYAEIVGDIVYLYSPQDDGTWSKEIADSFMTESIFMIEKLMDPDAYEKVDDQKNTYRMTTGALVALGVPENEIDHITITATIDKDSCTIKGKNAEQQMAEYVISKIGEIEFVVLQ